MQDKINKEKLTMEKFNEAIEKFSDKNLYYIYTPLKVYTDTDTKIITKLIKEGKLKKIFDSNSDDLFVISNEIYIIFKIQNIN